MKMNGNSGEVDLHVHTYFSDGLLSPKEIVEKALEMGLRAISITDHDSVDGVFPAIQAAEGTELEIVPGIEISASMGENEAHILGYLIDWKEGDLTKALNAMREKRIERMHKMVRLLQEKGMDISDEEVIESSPLGTIGRLQLARVMVHKNLVKNLRTAFDGYIGNGKPCHVGHEYLDYVKAINMIRKAGGVPVLAHPGTMGSDKDIPIYVEAGLRGLEAYHTKHWPATSDRYTEMASKYGLLITGGSDCHGILGKDMRMGKVRVGYDTVEKLREEARIIRDEKIS
ncbi:MAG: PHP domain-containing protein [Candidatus Omnitrophota bacterium]